ncbi:MAG: S49 family peptidase, partial [Proteobacteria bacterium]|nr:S49 family peptidase [Pseudomonadota bacterium]
FGVERRLYTAGEKKSILDAFSPQKEEDVKRLKSLQKELHDNFKALVRGRRGDRLKGSARMLFSGEFWTGTNAVNLGLVDGVGDIRSVMLAKFGDKVELRVLARRQGLMSMIRRDDIKWREAAPSLGDLGGDIAAGLLAAAEERFLWNRYGL